MKKIGRNIASFFANKKIYYIFLFIYFGFITIPQWYYDSSSLFFIWLLAFPLVAFAVVSIGVFGIIGILESIISTGKPSPKHISLTQISGVGLLAFVASISIAYGTHFLYTHQKFDAATWQDSNSAYTSERLSPRQRMLDDVVENILPGKNRDEIESLFGKSEDHGFKDSKNERYLIYILGPEKSLFAVDAEYILIWFDDLGNFERHEIINS